MIRQSDNSEFPVCRKPKWSEALTKPDTKTIRVVNGDVFFPLITVSEDFDWLQSDALAVRMNYHDPDTAADSNCLEFPLIREPKTLRRMDRLSSMLCDGWAWRLDNCHDSILDGDRWYCRTHLEDWLGDRMLSVDSRSIPKVFIGMTVKPFLQWTRLVCICRFVSTPIQWKPTPIHRMTGLLAVRAVSTVTFKLIDFR